MKRLLLALSLFAVGSEASPQALGPEFHVNTHTTGSQFAAAVASNASGAFVVVWQGEGDDDLDGGVLGRLYTSAGSALGPEFLVNTYTTGIQTCPRVATLASGDFLVVWAGNVEIWGRRYSGAGAPLTGEFRINDYTTNQQNVPSVSTDSSGGFVVAYLSRTGSPIAQNVYAHRYDAATNPLGAEFQVNVFTTTDQFDPKISVDGEGGFVVTWRSGVGDGSSAAVPARRYSP